MELEKDNLQEQDMNQAQILLVEILQDLLELVQDHKVLKALLQELGILLVMD